MSNTEKQAIILTLLILIPMLLTFGSLSLWWFCRRRRLTYFNEVVYLEIIIKLVIINCKFSVNKININFV